MTQGKDGIKGGNAPVEERRMRGGVIIPPHG